jgi:hypothetical protein
MKKSIIIFVLVILNINIALTDNDKKIEKLNKLNDAYKSGLITKEIFESSKKRIINSLGDNKKIKKKVKKKYSDSGKKPIAISWTGYSDLIAGEITFEEKNYEGSLSLDLPNNDGNCKGRYSLLLNGIGTWHITCSNNMAAHGTLKWVKNNAATGIGKDLNKQNVKFTVSK